MSWYRTGTVAATNGSTAITGTGTAFVTNNAQPGDAILLADGKFYEIATVPSDTSLTIVSPGYQGSTASGMAYAILPTNNRVGELATLAAQLLNSFAAVRDGVGQGLFPDGTVAAPGIRFLNDQDTGFYRIAANSMGYSAGGVMRVTFNTTGINGPIGATTPAPGTFTTLSASGAAALANHLYITTSLADDNAFFAINSHANGYGPFFRGGSGSRYVASFNKYDGTNIAEISGAGAVLPGSDNTQPVGGASFRWSVFYAGTGSINTSDANEKQQFGPIPDTWLDAWGEVEWSRFKFNDAVDLKGEDARWHCGLIAQAVHAAFAAHGLDAFNLGLCCFDEWDEEPATDAVTDENGEIIVPARPARSAGARWGLRYEECFATEAAWQRRRMALLEARIAMLEGH